MSNKSSKTPDSLPSYNSLYPGDDNTPGSPSASSQQAPPVVSRQQPHQRYHSILYSTFDDQDWGRADSFLYRRNDEKTPARFYSHCYEQLIKDDAEARKKKCLPPLSTYAWEANDSVAPFGLIGTLDVASGVFTTPHIYSYGHIHPAGTSGSSAAGKGKDKDSNYDLNFNDRDYSFSMGSQRAVSNKNRFLLTFFRKQEGTAQAHVTDLETALRAFDYFVCNRAADAIMPAVLHQEPASNKSKASSASTEGSAEMPTFVCFSRIPSHWQMSPEWIVDNQQEVFQMTDRSNRPLTGIRRPKQSKVMTMLGLAVYAAKKMAEQ